MQYRSELSDLVAQLDSEPEPLRPGIFCAAITAFCANRDSNQQSNRSVDDCVATLPDCTSKEIEAKIVGSQRNIGVTKAICCPATLKAEYQTLRCSGLDTKNTMTRMLYRVERQPYSS